MMKNKKPRKTKWILLFTLIAIVGILLIVALSNCDIFDVGIVPSEITMLIFVFLTLMPVLFLILFITWIIDAKKSKKAPPVSVVRAANGTLPNGIATMSGAKAVSGANVVSGANAVSGANPTLAHHMKLSAPAVSKEKNKMVNEGGSRFCMLSRISNIV